MSGEKARELFLNGYNCAQAVFCSYAEEYGLEEKVALRISSSFGGGMGRTRNVCGAVTGMIMAAGLIYGDYDPKDHDAKANHYKLVRDLIDAFREKHGTILCSELLGVQDTGVSEPTERTPEFYEKRPCPGLIFDAAEILREYIEREKDADK